MVNSREIRGLLFDKDGTLFDFEKSWAVVVDQTLAMLTPDRDLSLRMAHAVGYDPGAQRFQPGAPSVAGATREIAEIWAGFLPGRGVDAIEAVANEVGASAVAESALCPAVPDLGTFLAALQARGYVLGVATHDSEDAARAHLTAVGALDPFRFIAGYDSGHGLKPGPGMLMAFARATNLDPAEIVMIGDSVDDLGVAPAAGAAMAIGVLTGPATRADLAPHADHVLDSIADLPGLLGFSL